MHSFITFAHGQGFLALMGTSLLILETFLFQLGLLLLVKKTKIKILQIYVNCFVLSRHCTLSYTFIIVILWHRVTRFILHSCRVLLY